MSNYRSRIDQLVPPTITPSAKHQGVRQDVLHHIELDRLRPSPANPRTTYPDDQIKQMAESLASIGQQQPITCYWSAAEGAYVIVAGHCRYFGAKQAGLKSLAAVVVAEELDDVMQLIKRLAENTSRNDLDPLDCARAMRRAMDERQLTQQQVAKSLGRSQAWVSGQLALLALPEDQQAKLQAGQVGITEARAAVVKRPRKRRGPKRIRLVIGGLQAVVTFKRARDECSAVQALERLRAAAEQADAKQEREAA